MRSRPALAAALVVSAILSVVLAETCAARRRGGFVGRAESEASVTRAYRALSPPGPARAGTKRLASATAPRA